MKRRLLNLVLAGALVFLAAQRTARAEAVEANAPTGEVWSVQRFQREFCGADNWEPFNRTMFGIMDCCMEYVVDPFCYLYSSIIPKPLIKGLDNFSENLEAPCRICSNLLMAEWLPAWDSVRRFVINSTVGIGGLFDPADSLFNIYETNASLSDTFARWHVPSGPSLALPFLPRASVRGHVGYLLDWGLDLKFWFDIVVPTDLVILGYSSALIPNKAPVWRGTWENVFGHANDRYSVYMPLVTTMTDFNLNQFVWNYQENLYDRIVTRLRAQELPEGSDARQEMEARAKSYFEDVRPPVHGSAKRPDGLKGRWCEIPGYAPRSPSLDSLRALCYAPLGDDDFWWERRSVFNRDFSRLIDDRAVVISNGLPKAAYSFVPAPEAKEGEVRPERLAVIIPGIGASRAASEAVAMAELLHSKGFHAVVCNSIFHWESMRSLNCGILPGYLSEDVKRLANCLSLIVADLQAEGLIGDPEIDILGWSMGGLTVAHLAALDDRDQLPIRVARFISINPPASMEHALAKFVPVYESSRNWSREHAYKMLTEVSHSLAVWTVRDHPRFDPENPPLNEIGEPWNYAPNLTEEQANYLLGQTIRVIFPTLVTERHRTAPIPWIKSDLTWFRRNDFYAEVGDLSMDEYIHRYLPTCYPGVTAEEMIATGEISRLEPALLRNMKLSVIHSWNDPLEEDSDRFYFDRIFGDRISWFADGGHCGYFYTKPFETELLRRLEE